MTKQTYARPIYTTPMKYRGDPRFVTIATGVREKSTGKMIAGLEKVGELPSQVCQSLSFLSSAASVVNLGISVASFAYMKTSFDKMERTLSSISSKVEKIDLKVDRLNAKVESIQEGVWASLHGISVIANHLESQRRIEVFAEIGAVLDALSYADDVDETSAKSIVASNMVPLNKAVRLFNAFIDELESPLAAADSVRLETQRLRLLAESLLVKADILMGRSDKARARAETLLAGVYDLVHAVVGNLGDRVLTDCKTVDEMLTRARFVGEISKTAADQVLANALLSRSEEKTTEIIRMRNKIMAKMMLDFSENSNGDCGFFDILIEINRLSELLGVSSDEELASKYGEEDFSDLFPDLLGGLLSSIPLEVRLEFIFMPVENYYGDLSDISHLTGDKLTKGCTLSVTNQYSDTIEIKMPKDGWVVFFGENKEGDRGFYVLASQDEYSDVFSSTHYVLSNLEALLGLAKGINMETHLLEVAGAVPEALRLNLKQPLEDCFVLGPIDAKDEVKTPCPLTAI